MHPTPTHEFLHPRDKVIVGLGEILWDLLPHGRLLGGAPANFAYHAAQLGDHGIPASRVGRDELGEDILRRLRTLSLTTDYLQIDPDHPTGTVNVEIHAGQPRYTIVDNVAWDYLQWTPEWESLARRADAVCFGSLAQRSSESRSTILRFLDHCREAAVRIFDINLRQHFFSRELIEKGLEHADIAKMNDEELPRVARLLEFTQADETEMARKILERFELDMICITRGGNGSMILTPDATASHDGFRVQVADTIGSGDAYVAAVAHHYLRGAPLDRIVQAANRLGAHVASESGATPRLHDSILAEVC